MAEEGKIIEYYLPGWKYIHGLVFVERYPNKASRTGYGYSASFTYDFVIVSDVTDARGYELEGFLRKARETFREMKRLHDLGDYPLFYKVGGDNILRVGLTDEFEREKRIKARDVPPGSFLAVDALNFFRFYKGADAVDMRRQKLLR